MFRRHQPRPAATTYDPAQPQGAFPPIGTTLPSPYYYSGDQPVRTAGPGVSSPAKPRGGRRVWFRRILKTVLILALLAGLYIGGTLLWNAGKAFDGNLFGLLQNEKLEGEDTGRVNILVAGNSSVDAGHNGAALTDSIMIVSIDTQNKRAFTMSVPRDLWVDIPGSSYAKINEVYQDGEEDGFNEPGYAEGGMGLLQKVIGQNFGMEFHYYALVNYSAFKEAVDAVGGIEVNIQSDDPRGLYDPSRDWTKPRYAPLVKLPNGPSQLDGQEALNLARARGQAAGSYGYAQSDYTRSANQRLMLVALKDKATGAGVALNPVKIASLMESFGNNVKTDFQTSEVRRLFDLSKEIPSNKITSVGLNDVDGESLLAACQYSCRGQSALVPAAGLDDYSDIRAYIGTLTAPPPAPAATSEQ